MHAPLPTLRAPATHGGERQTEARYDETKAARGSRFRDVRGLLICSSEHEDGEQHDDDDQSDKSDAHIRRLMLRVDHADPWRAAGGTG